MNAFTRAAAVATLAAAVGVVPAAADPKPAGCAGAAPASRSCAFTVAAGHEGLTSYSLFVVSAGAVRGRLEIKKGSTVVFTTGDATYSGPAGAKGALTDGIALAPGSYVCQVVGFSGAAAVAFECGVA